MEKTYKFILPQNKEVQSTKVRVENGEAFVDVEFKEQLQPKDGDFLVSNTGIFICKIGEKDNHLYAYAGEDNNKVCIDVDGMIWALRSRIRYATPEEKAAFLERLEKECGKAWNAKTKQLEDIRWTPKEGEVYYFIDYDCEIGKTTFSNSFHVDKTRAKGNDCFKTEEAAQKVADQIKEIFKNSKVE